METQLKMGVLASLIWAKHKPITSPKIYVLRFWLHRSLEYEAIHKQFNLVILDIVILLVKLVK